MSDRPATTTTVSLLRNCSMTRKMKRLLREAFARIDADRATGSEVNGKEILLSYYRGVAEDLAERLFLSVTTESGWSLETVRKAAQDSSQAYADAVKVGHLQSGLADPDFDENAADAIFNAFYRRLEALFRAGQPAGAPQ